MMILERFGQTCRAAPSILVFVFSGDPKPFPSGSIPSALTLHSLIFVNALWKMLWALHKVGGPSSGVPGEGRCYLQHGLLLYGTLVTLFTKTSLVLILDPIIESLWGGRPSLSTSHLGMILVFLSVLRIH